MAKLSFLSLSFSLVFLFVGCLAQLGSQQQYLWQNLQQQQQHRLRAKTDCRIQRLTAQEPSRTYRSEAGFSEFWDRNNEQFECAGVAAVRNVIQTRGLFLPHYNSAPQLLYVVQGRGLLGIVIPGCAETFESETQQGSESQRRFLDRHQKVRQFRQGDVLALPAGVTLWFYNNGDEQIVTVSLLDTANEMNQLDLKFRNFFLAGNQQSGRQSQGQQEGESQGKGESENSNIFNGFEDEVLADAFKVETETIRKLKGQGDRRGRIVKAEKFNVVFPREEEEEQQRQQGQQGRGGPNGLEETLCTMRLRENLAHPTRADIYNPRAGRLATLNGQTLPILNLLQLSAVRGVLYKNAIMAPHWNVNAHSAIYITRGSGRFQVVGESGKLVFDDEVREGQLIIIPQNFVVVKKAGEQGCEWIAFKTNDNAMISPLAGRLSVFRSMPIEVLMNAYQISRKEAEKLKYSREESTVFSSSSSSSRSAKPKSLEYAWDVIKSVM
ncbi:12S seed storage protein CRB [Abeliophyllum distichum]|uniref:12S seed storage protein CRB n=1 Tax=Abeliophyllum distichum TaxID=126358 RepID=A0ABD1T1K3_9LAMI